MEGRWTLVLDYDGYLYELRPGHVEYDAPEGWEAVPVVPCDDAAVKRAERAARGVLIAATDIVPAGDEPFVGWSQVLAERVASAVLLAAGETP